MEITESFISEASVFKVKRKPRTKVVDTFESIIKNSPDSVKELHIDGPGIGESSIKTFDGKTYYHDNYDILERDMVLSNLQVYVDYNGESGGWFYVDILKSTKLKTLSVEPSILIKEACNSLPLLQKIEKIEVHRYIQDGDLEKIKMLFPTSNIELDYYDEENEIISFMIITPKE
jgi:hypothetical protein